MIYVTLGTQSNDFSRCLRALDKIIEQRNIHDRIVVQSGYTNYKSPNFEMVSFVKEDEYKNFIRQADLIISHAGSGAIFNAIKYKKKIIAIARLRKFGEIADDHQLELLEKLEQDGYLINGTFSLNDAFDKLKDFNPKKFDLPNDIINYLDNYISSILH